MSGASDDFGLDPRARALLENVFERHPRIVEARVFGSRALGTYRGESDIDIALYGDLDEALVARVAGELEELPLPYQFDVRAYSTVRHAGLLKHIERVGRRIFARRGAPATGRRDPRGGGRGFRARWVDPPARGREGLSGALGGPDYFEADFKMVMTKMKCASKWSKDLFDRKALTLAEAERGRHILEIARWALPTWASTITWFRRWAAPRGGIWP